MIDPNDMKLAWNLYLALGGVAVLLWVLLWHGMRWGALRIWLTLAAIAFLFAPVHHPDVPGLWVPANTAAALSWIGDGLDAALPALISLGMAQLAALLLAALAFFVLRGRGQKGDTAPVTTKKAENDRIEPSIAVDLGEKHASNIQK